MRNDGPMMVSLERDCGPFKRGDDSHTARIALGLRGAHCTVIEIEKLSRSVGVVPEGAKEFLAVVVGNSLNKHRILSKARSTYPQT